MCRIHTVISRHVRKYHQTNDVKEENRQRQRRKRSPREDRASLRRKWVGIILSLVDMYENSTKPMMSRKRTVNDNVVKGLHEKVGRHCAVMGRNHTVISRHVRKYHQTNDVKEENRQRQRRKRSPREDRASLRRKWVGIILSLVDMYENSTKPMMSRKRTVNDNVVKGLHEKVGRHCAVMGRNHTVISRHVRK